MTTASSPFASRTVPEHLLRGIAAAALAVFAVWMLASPGLLSGALALAAFVGAVFLLRGCPMCWLVGLAETVARRRTENGS